ncbi:cytochrome c biogenesis protein DipZ [Propionibacterium australiense]|uniref:Alkyl hydroperoxide reductase subunit C/ Thiol specific antioxidant n=1 Tax=Propionibacterium australiense TaxID=119981 RepID=A0A383S402_9ACTN|nr:cytochrome c biogenesis protein DipZ [Propionibacterium australiense]RLP11677.1 cytochrome c biogenesis protein DipZ [Propionibacterium australiense]RLP12190.1 cytochrome c biogenesis protein DipZ [Propionibacterium australiense]SYZ32411.1 Alkyl hydroperoxide reductase subunit C/ Thiol specific antioxidant [Propionibacterium australiense]VEH90264.1 thiol-disulfide oxidoreductase [Propionibacterium australiense]
MLFTAVLSLLAGVLTVLAPCVLPFLPVIVGGSLNGSRHRPYVIAGSLVVSLMAFTLLLKASTALIKIDPRVWTTVSGGLVIALGVMMLFPGIWTSISTRIGLEQGSHALLSKAQNQGSGTASAVLTGVALGPVFSSCSPTYAWLIASVLPASRTAGLAYLGLYCIGMTAALLGISLLGRRLIDKVKWAANPRGAFQRGIAALFIIVGLFVATGLDRKVQTWAVEKLPTLSALEEKVLPKDQSGNTGDGQPKAIGQDMSHQAPELEGIQQWINSDPLTLERLRGKVTLIDFWTYSCINCVRTQPYLNAWYDNYRDQGLQIIGVHAPEFAFEKEPENVAKAVREAGIKYPVALDNDFATWRAYGNQYWPAKYLIDQEGKVRYTHFGEGAYEETEKKIRELLNSTGPMAQASSDEHAASDQSPETYLGTNRARGYRGNPSLRQGTTEHEPERSLASNEWTLSGRWKADGESITSDSDGATLTYKFDGRELYLVMGGQSGTVKVKVNGEERDLGPDAPGGVAEVDEHRLYRLVSLPSPKTGTTVELTFNKGITANAFTFGG